MLLIIALGAGCGAPPAPSGSAAPSAAPAPGAAAPQQSLALTYAYPDNAATDATAQALIKAYTSSHPDVQITARPLPAKEYAQQLLGQLESNPPDLFLSA